MKTKIKVLLCLATLVILGSTSCTRISPTEAAFKIDNTGNYRGIDTVPLLSGTQWYFPYFSKIVTIPTTQQHIVWTASTDEGSDKNQEIIVLCKGGAGFKMDVGLNYEINPLKAFKIYIKYNTSDLTVISATYLRNVVRNTMQDVSGQITVDSMLNDLPGYQQTVNNILSEKLSKEGFIIDLFSIIGKPTPSDSGLAASINAKIKSKQDAETSRMQVQQAIAEADKKVAEARGDSLSTLINASAAAEANAKMLQSLTPLLIQKQYIDKWNGQLPTYMFGGGSQNLMLNVPGSK